MTTTTTSLLEGPRSALPLDGHGNPMSGSPAAVERYDLAVDRLLRFHPDVVDLATELVTEHPDVPMGQVLMAYLCLMSTDPADLPGARDAHRALTGLATTRRERAHAEAVGQWLRGNWTGASATLDALLVEWPRDLLALAIGHQLDFYLGDRANLRDRIGRSLATLDGHDHHAFALGMQAFGLEESGTLDAALDAGLAAVAAHADDVWAIHAVAHVHEVRGDVDEGLRFLVPRRADWGDGNLFDVHLWWHYALYLLEAGRTADVLDVYDDRIHHAASACVPLEMLDAATMLWRLQLDGIDTGSRFSALAEAWGQRGDEEQWYVFNDVHHVMACCGAGRVDEARALLEPLARTAVGRGTNARMAAEVGLPTARALVAFAEDRPDDALADLLPIRAVLNRFGGSNAQRDVFAQTAIEAARRAGRADLAEALVRERLALRPSSVFGWSRAQLLTGEGQGRADQARARFAALAPVPPLAR